MGMKEVAGIWLPESEEHMVPFLEDRSRWVDGRGSYQVHKLRAALERVRSFRRAIDIGSHVGTWAMHLAPRFAHLECFEPHPLHAACWQRNVRHANAHLYEVALGNGERDVRLCSNPHSSGDTCVSAEADPSAEPHRDTITVPMRRLDAYSFDDVDFVKIDCEGYEHEVLLGATGTIQRCRPTIIVEQKPGRAEKYGLGRTDACTLLEQWGARRVRHMAGDFIYAFD